MSFSDDLHFTSSCRSFFTNSLISFDADSFYPATVVSVLIHCQYSDVEGRGQRAGSPHNLHTKESMSLFLNLIKEPIIYVIGSLNLSSAKPLT